MLHTLAVMVENDPGVLARVSGLFSRRGYNIYSLTVCQTENPDLSMMTIVVEGDSQVIEQVTKQLHKLVVVHKVTNLSQESVVNRELALIRVKVKSDTRLEVLQTVDIFRGRVVDMGKNNLTIELTGDEDKIDAFVRTMRSYGILELVRTGKIVIARSDN
ncbi:MULTISPECIES: acetolactate synthase small subunit [Dehalobacter]|jgi:acetolactate synthase-1/3 small subunit|uniref:Acetolactate synthase small subunit n=2 Tax=Dehalobacter restrictus TaxID=55583 RepID=A0A857DJ95_9FIRM|nr:MULTISPECIES: acetolactate synthase small subunit [Dehalobacter]AHF10191.1 acetolactate synthase [Dehalobacter restrictus DSM 9455]MCG1024229.1 acetolactate synthase small subunit [Dehalobacter sp.]MDJ0307168.1 acetolactate synthase small subunit [Dehalobacter sp.]OCZ50460.1 acetolactate synthase small subunit [Dehalobacter sp. TeCB1]QHA00781.1 acetolactate synthase small subunit [Dehalobacter restrictus]